MVNVEQERKKFELWLQQELIPFFAKWHPNENRYTNVTSIQLFWKCWMASASEERVNASKDQENSQNVICLSTEDESIKGKRFISFDRLGELCSSIEHQLSYNRGNYDYVVGILRGGAFPALQLSHRLGVPMKTIEYSSLLGKGDKRSSNVLPDWVVENGTKRINILLVDDIVDSGNTMKETVELLSQHNVFSTTASLFYKQTSIFKPDVFAEELFTDDWIVFPYE